ncbi:hypothetical protein DFAR_230005 [Desulfarculales bacterium]
MPRIIGRSVFCGFRFTRGNDSTRCGPPGLYGMWATWGSRRRWIHLISDIMPSQHNRRCRCQRRGYPCVRSRKYFG